MCKSWLSYQCLLSANCSHSLCLNLGPLIDCFLIKTSHSRITQIVKILALVDLCYGHCPGDYVEILLFSTANDSSLLTAQFAGRYRAVSNARYLAPSLLSRTINFYIPTFFSGETKHRIHAHTAS